MQHWQVHWSYVGALAGTLEMHRLALADILELRWNCGGRYILWSCIGSYLELQWNCLQLYIPTQFQCNIGSTLGRYIGAALALHVVLAGTLELRWNNVWFVHRRLDWQGTLLQGSVFQCNFQQVHIIWIALHQVIQWIWATSYLQLKLCCHLLLKLNLTTQTQPTYSNSTYLLKLNLTTQTQTHTALILNLLPKGKRWQIAPPQLWDYRWSRRNKFHLVGHKVQPTGTD